MILFGGKRDVDDIDRNGDGRMEILTGNKSQKAKLFPLHAIGTVESRYKKFVRQRQTVSYIEIFLILILRKNPL